MRCARSRRRNDRLGSLIGRLVVDGAEFEEVMNSSKDQMTQLGRSAAILPAVASRLENAGAATSALAQSDEATLEALFSRYTMERECDVHRQFLRGFGLTPKESTKEPSQVDADDGLLLF